MTKTKMNENDEIIEEQITKFAFFGTSIFAFFAIQKSHQTTTRFSSIFAFSHVQARKNCHKSVMHIPFLDWKECFQ